MPPGKFVIRYCLVFLGILIILFGLLTLLDSSGRSRTIRESDPMNTTVHNFRKDKYLREYFVRENTTKIDVDLMLNIRKLTLFAVHELNKIKGNVPGPCEPSNCGAIKWWTTPLKIIYLKTTHYPTFWVHTLIFNLEPGNIPIYVKVKQNHVTLQNILETNELEIRGNFMRLYDKSVIKSNEPGIYDKEVELDTWWSHVSFIVSDYLRLNDKSAFIIAPRSGAADYCAPSLKMLIMVCSEPARFLNRQIIRQTYGVPEKLIEKKVKVVFLFGRFGNKTLQSLIEKEAKEHEDIIQVAFMDSYHNLTLSHLSMYNWIHMKCGMSMPKHVLKADDDFFINVDLALRIAEANPEAQLIGVSYCGKEPVRDTLYMDKYYTPHYMYTAAMYPGYVSGIAYLVRTDVIPGLLQMSLTTPMIHMDDVYVTGLLTRQLGIIPRWSPLFSTLKCKLDHCETKKLVNCYAETNMEDIRTYWKDWMSPAPENCSLEKLDLLVEQQTHDSNLWCYLE